MKNTQLHLKKHKGRLTLLTRPYNGPNQCEAPLVTESALMQMPPLFKEQALQTSADQRQSLFASDPERVGPITCRIT